MEPRKSLSGARSHRSIDPCPRRERSRRRAACLPHAAASTRSPSVAVRARHQLPIRRMWSPRRRSALAGVESRPPLSGRRRGRRPEQSGAAHRCPGGPEPGSADAVPASFPSPRSRRCVDRAAHARPVPPARFPAEGAPARHTPVTDLEDEVISLTGRLPDPRRDRPAPSNTPTTVPSAGARTGSPKPYQDSARFGSPW